MSPRARKDITNSEKLELLDMYRKLPKLYQEQSASRLEIILSGVHCTVQTRFILIVSRFFVPAVTPDQTFPIRVFCMQYSDFWNSSCLWIQLPSDIQAHQLHLNTEFWTQNLSYTLCKFSYHVLVNHPNFLTFHANFLTKLHEPT